MMPMAKFIPIPPRFLKEATATAISVRIKADMGSDQRLCRTNR